ncbi:MAG: hypothetical protein QOE31_3096 [Solirubrobacteraceae bacterium]|nr:hypothetical protein [Solirubrobacteraceae bacterium]
MLIGLAYTAWAAASLGYNVSVASGHQPAIPSLADAGWLVVYPLMFVGFVGVMRARHVRLSARAWLDGLIGALALAALISTFLVDAVEMAGAGDLRVVATLLAYPLADVALMWLVLTIGTELGWRLGRDWLLIATALVLQVCSDVLYAYKAAAGTWHYGTLLDTAWIVSGLLIAWAAWHPPSATRRVAADDHWHSLILPALCTIVALTILALINPQEFPTTTVLAAATILTSFVRAVTVSQQKRAFRDLALRDSLTGLFNHGAFHAELESEVERGRESTDRFSVVLFDLDGFKQINDRCGHAEGDRVLQEVAAVIAAVLRSEDVSARIGGDEFAVLLRGAGAPAATAVAQRASEIVRERGIGIGMSFGVGTWPVDGRSTNLLLLRADTAMYAAKSAGAIKRQHDVDVSGALTRRSPPDVQRDTRDPDQREQLLAYARNVRTSHARELRRSQELNDSYLATVRTLAAAVEAKDDYTGCHIQRVHGLGLLLAQTVIPQQASDPQLSYGLLLHDMWARMFAVVDTVDAITSDRPYRQARPLDVALAELVEGSGSQFDPACVQAFLRIDRRLIELLLEQQGTAIPCISELVLPEYALSDPG